MQAGAPHTKRKRHGRASARAKASTVAPHTPHTDPTSYPGLLLILSYLPWLLLLGWLASVAWFLCDDAFIGFRYVRNLLEGHGLVFNPGEYVEGYTNFLFLLELAAIWSLAGIPPEHAAPFLSVACTAGTLAAMGWWVHRMPSLSHRGLVGWMALGLVCSSATFAVWTSAGGLEIRQFTFFLIVAIVALSAHGTRRGGLLIASLSFAAAELTRPEGLLLGACGLGGFAVARMASGRQPRLDWRDLAVMGGPFTFVVTAHYLWRYSYYGEWLPNTYYAKYVSPWYESGLRYLTHAGIETGLYLLVPLALVAGIVRWKRYQDGSYAVILLMIGVHMHYLARIGGDHFEYRPLDFYWPLLAVAASEGILYLGTQIATRVQHIRHLPVGGLAPRAWAFMLFAPVLFYASAIQGAVFYEGTQVVGFSSHRYSELNEKNAGQWLVAPGMSKLVAISNTLRQQSTRHMAPSPWTEHRGFARLQLRLWKPYEHMARGTIPDDAVGAATALGIESYYQPDLEIIDLHGLTDATVARNPQTEALDGLVRRIAHERQSPPGYLAQRGMNFHSKPVARSLEEALRRANYALEFGPNLWMPFDAKDPRWVAERFAGQNVKSRQSR